MTQNRPQFHLLLHASHLLEERLRNTLSRLEVPPAQARMIDAISKAGECSQGVLAREFHISPASMSSMTRRLVANGTITRREDLSDARNKLLSLTPKGRALMKEISLAWQSMDALIVDAVGAQTADALFSGGKALRDALGGRAPVRPATPEIEKPVQTL